ncbi:MAG: A/G-specific adenine glycosylase [Rhodobacteraceae bacterium]|nr:A/G-specific adenine glycosylase [Paracoccaceae bacterium]
MTNHPAAKRVAAHLNRRLLAWYDRHGRDLPWRLHPARRRKGQLPDPYRVWLSEILLQQTSVATVSRHFDRLVQRWPTVLDLAAAEEPEVLSAWAGLGYYSRARNLLQCARLIARDFDGEFPAETSRLLPLPGIGTYTAAAIAAIAFDRPAVVVDGNIERVLARLFAVHTVLPDAKPRIRALAAELTPDQRPGDWCQALMDLGALICIPKSPRCVSCPLADDCAAKRAGIAELLPRRRRAKPRQQRRGVLYVGRREDGAWLLERRPGQGLFAGLLAWPGTGWDGTVSGPPSIGNWQEAGRVRHILTHLELDLRVYFAELALDVVPVRGFFVHADEFDISALPVLMRKALAVSRNWRPRQDSNL